MRTLIIILLSILLYSCSKESTVEGDRYFTNGDYAMAIEAYNDYLDGSPKHIKSLYNRGRSYEELGEFGKALDDYKAVLDIDNKHVQANLSVGVDAFRNNDPERALYFFGQSVSASPENYKALVLRGRAFHKLGNFTSAMKDFNSALQINGEGGDAYFYRGIILLNSNKKKACVDFQKASNLGIKDARKALEKYCI